MAHEAAAGHCINKGMQSEYGASKDSVDSRQIWEPHSWAQIVSVRSSAGREGKDKSNFPGTTEPVANR
jgi:hypothetical protein